MTAFPLTRAQVREVDRLSTEKYKIPGIVLMENAARGAAEVALRMLAPRPGPVFILCGGGNNGGDGYAIARHLANHDHEVVILSATDPAKLTGDALLNFRIIRQMNLTVTPVRPGFLAGDIVPSLIVDAIFGTGLTAAPRDPFPDIARRLNAWHVPVLAIDLPSGLDADTGEPLGPDCIRATQTVTFVAEKAGFANPASRAYTGPVTVADIGCPRRAIREALGNA